MGSPSFHLVLAKRKPTRRDHDDEDFTCIVRLETATHFANCYFRNVSQYSSISVIVIKRRMGRRRKSAIHLDSLQTEIKIAGHNGWR